MDLSRGYYDISPVIGEKSAIFPGDTPFSRRIVQDFDHGDPILLTTLTTTPHIGAHADAPSHYHQGGKGIDGIALEPYLGRCQVIELSIPRDERIRPAHLEKGGKQIRAPRILFKTGSFPDPDRWNGDFNSLSAELIEWLAKAGVILIGLDTPSVDPAEDKGLESHHAIWRAQVRNLEGLDLSRVPEGTYTLIALPLRIAAADASPVRAILVKDASA